jgi:hypothetical protein
MSLRGGSNVCSMQSKLEDEESVVGVVQLPFRYRQASVPQSGDSVRPYCDPEDQHGLIFEGVATNQSYSSQ